MMRRSTPPVVSERSLLLNLCEWSSPSYVLNMMAMTGKWDIYAGYVRSLTNILPATDSGVINLKSISSLHRFYTQSRLCEFVKYVFHVSSYN